MADVSDTERQAVDPDAGEVPSVTELNDRIASVVEDAPAPNDVRCIGEATDLHQNSTALYFTLTDSDAEIPSMIWANRYEKIKTNLKNGTGIIFEGNPITGQKVRKSTSNRGR